MWRAAQMKPMLCHPGRHKAARVLQIPWDGPTLWICTCSKCGHRWTEPA